MDAHYLKKELYRLIQKDETIFDFIQKSSLDGLWYRDLKNPGNEWINPRFWEVLGYTPEEMPHKTSAWQSIIHPDDLKTANELFRIHASNPKYPYDLEVRYTHKKGSTVWMRCRGLIIRNKDGKPERMVGTNQNITSLKREEEKYRFLARETTHNLRNLRAASNITTIFLDKKLEVLQFFPGEHMDEYIQNPEETTLDNIANHYKTDDLSKDCEKVLKSSKAIEKELICVHGMVWWMRISPYKSLKERIEGLIITLTDITEKKHLDNEVRLLTDALENSIDAYDIVDENGIFVYVNRSYLQMWGYDTTDEVIGTSPAIHCVDPETPAKIIKKVMQDGKAEMEFEAQRKNGSTFDVLMSVTRFIDTNGKVYFPTFSKDITRKKQQEAELEKYRNHLEELVKQKTEELTKSESRYRQLVETASDSIFLFDNKGTVIDTNNTAAQMLGRKRNEITGSSIDTFDSNFSIKEFTEFWENSPMNKQQIFETTYINKKGKLIPVEVSAKKFTIGSRYFIYGIARDITDRKETEERLKQSEQKFIKYFDFNPSAIFVWEYRNNEFVLIDVNQTAKDITEGNALKFIGIKASEIYGDMPELIKHLEECIKTKTPSNFEVYHKNRYKGTYDWLNFKLVYAEPNIILLYSDNINQQKFAEKEIRRQRDMFESVINLVPVHIFWKDKNGVYLGCNPNFAEDAGVESADRVIGKTDESFVWSENAKQIRTNDREVMDTGKAKLHYEESFIGIDGEEIIWKTSKIPLKNNEGEIIGVLATSDNITERKISENKLKESEERYRLILENSMDAILQTAPEGTIYSANKAAEIMFGMSEKEICQAGITGLVDKEDLRLKNLIEERERLGQASGELTMIRKNKTKFPVELSSSLYKSQKGDLLGSMTIRDISQRKEAENTIIKSQKLLLEAQETAHIAHWTFNPETGIPWWSEELYRIYARKPENGPLPYSEHPKLVHPDDWEWFDKTVSETADTGKPFNIVLRILRPSGEVRYINSICKPVIDKSGAVVEMRGTIQDITQQQTYEKKIELSEKRLKEAQKLASIGNFEQNTQTGEMWWSEEVFNILGFTPEETPPTVEEFSNRLDTENANKMNRFMHDVITSGQGSTLIYKILIPSSKTYKYISTSAKVHIDELTKTKIVKGTIQDITERIKAEQKLKVQNENYEALNEELRQTNDELKATVNREMEVNDRFNKAMDATSDGLFDWNLITGKIYYSPRWKSIVGYMEDELPNDFSIWEKLTDPDDVKRSLKMVDALIKGKEEKFDIEFKMRHKEGHWVDIHSRANVFKNEKGKASRIVGTHTDITERKIAEKKIRESEEKLRLAIDNSPLGITINDLEGNFLSVNKAYKKIVGYEEKELLNMNFFDITHPDYLSENKNLFDAMANNHAHGFAIDKKYIHKNGNLVDVRIHAGSIRNEKGEIIFGMAFTEDITNEKEAARELQKLYDELQVIYENDPTFIIFKDTQNNILRITKTVAQMTGLPKEDIEGKPSKDIYPEMADKYYQDDLEVMQSGKPKMGIIEPLPTADGKTKWLLTNKIPYLDENKQIQGIILFSTDITELKQSEERFKHAEHIGKVGHWEYNIKTKEFWASNEAMQMYGFDPEQKFISLEDAEKKIPDRKRTHKALMDLIEKDIPYDLDYDIIIPETGETKSLHTIAVTEKDQQGKVFKVTGVIQNITERIKFEKELVLAKDKAEESNRLKTEFLHNMSHEIRTPMNGIMGFSNLMCKLEGLTDKQRNYASIIQNSSKQLLNIINDILEISTLETKQLTVKESEMDVNQFIMELFAIYDIKSKERNLPLYVKKELPIGKSEIITDKTKLNKILSNLIDNAFKFTSSGKIEFGYFIKGSKIIFFVSDTGIGISNDKKQKIFNRFSQEDAEIANTYGGLGLGLSIAKENSELLGGTISVQSKKGKGTTFFVEIPYKTSVYIYNERVKVKDSIKKTIHIVIAEDEEVNYLYLEAILEKTTDFNVKLTHVINGKETVDLCLHDNTIDIVLMDIKMPVMNGYEATRIIKTQKPDLPIIAQTAYSTPLEKEMAIKHGFDGFISKPIDKTELLQSIDKHIINR